MRPICAGCKRMYRVKKNGVYFEEGMPRGSNQPTTLLEEQECTPDRHDWAPYKLWVGDLYECPGCGAQLISGVGQGPIAEHFQPDYQQWVQSLRPTLRINDC